MKTKVVAEIGINHNGSPAIAKALIDTAKSVGCAYVKFQRAVPATFPDDTWRREIALSQDDFVELLEYSRQVGIDAFASACDLPSAQNLWSISDEMVKIPSCCLRDYDLLRFCRDRFKKLLISTGMSEQCEIDNAIMHYDPDVIFHCVSAYPTPAREINLGYIARLRRQWPSRAIGYSGHEIGFGTTAAAVVMGATWIERHITLSSAMEGPDHVCSLEPYELREMIARIQEYEWAVDGDAERVVYPCEELMRTTHDRRLHQCDKL
jgi:N-acetylneuraminate synthase